jgi:hypothetical protein
MHPAHEGLSAMPFYDDFDLSTVDVLLISQYVFARFDSYCQHRVEGTGRITAVGPRVAESIMQSASCISVSMEYYLHPLRSTSMMYHPVPTHVYTTSGVFPTLVNNLPQDSPVC